MLSLIPELEGDYHSYFGEDCLHCFLQQMIALQQKAIAVYWDDKRFNRDLITKTAFRIRHNCHICCKPFLPEDSDKLLDHEHFTGKYRGVGHNKCNAA